MSVSLQKGEIQTLVVYPPEDLRGDVSTATVRFMTSSVAMQDEGGGVSGTVSAFDSTLTAEALEGATVVVVASAVGAVKDRRILIGASLVAEIESIDGLNVTLRLPLPENIASGTEVKGLDLSISLDATATAEAGNCLSEWEVDGGRKFLRPFFIVSREVAYVLDTATLFRLAPRARQLVGPEDADAADAIEAAWTSEVARVLKAEGLKPEMIYSWEEINSWHAAATVFHLSLNAARETPEDRDAWSIQMQTQRIGALGSRRIWYSENDGLAGRPDNPVGFNRTTWSL